MSIHAKALHSVSSALDRIHRMRSLSRTKSHVLMLDAVAEHLRAAIRQIEDDAQRPASRASYPFDGVQPGGFFELHDVLSIGALRVAASTHGRRNGQRWAVRKQEGGSVRVYRVS